MVGEEEALIITVVVEVVSMTIAVEGVVAMTITMTTDQKTITTLEVEGADIEGVGEEVLTMLILRTEDDRTVGEHSSHQLNLESHLLVCLQFVRTFMAMDLRKYLNDIRRSRIVVSVEYSSPCFYSKIKLFAFV